jgi:hypothetical protein
MSSSRCARGGGTNCTRWYAFATLRTPRDSAFPDAAPCRFAVPTASCFIRRRGNDSGTSPRAMRDRSSSLSGGDGRAVEERRPHRDHRRARRCDGREAPAWSHSPAGTRQARLASSGSPAVGGRRQPHIADLACPGSAVTDHSMVLEDLTAPLRAVPSRVWLRSSRPPEGSTRWLSERPRRIR